FSSDANEIVQHKELGSWSVENIPNVNGVILTRTLIDAKGTTVTLLISQSEDYPRRPPLVKSHPRIPDLNFLPTGLYEGPAILSWNERKSKDALFRVCEELRKFEDPARVFMSDARA